MKLIATESLSELLNMIAKQKAISNKVVREIHAEVMATNILVTPANELTEETLKRFNNKITDLIDRYAQQPTLSEIAALPSSQHGAVWGNSFAISSIVGSVLLKNWSGMFPELQSVIRPLFMQILDAHVTPENSEMSLLERLLANMKFDLRDQHGLEILGEERDRLIRSRMSAFLALVAETLTAFGILELDSQESSPEQVAARITPRGVRVFKHLVDVEQYITEVSELYPKLSNQLETT